jgi:ABC-type transport system substrate-binding protein
VVFRPITDANTRVAEMLSGGIDLMVEVPPDNVAMFADDATLRGARAGRPASLVPDPQH